MTLAQDITRHFGGEWHGTYGAFPAPGHSPSDRGVTVKDADGGRDVLFNSFNGADWRDIKDECRRIGLLPEWEQSAADSQPRETGHYEYANAEGTVLYRTVRIEQAGKRKRFAAQRPDGRGGWTGGIGGIQRVLYRLPELAAADPAQPVYFVEGERKADKLASWGFVATAIAFGAKGWQRDYAAALSGRTVIFLPDNDDTGREFAAKARADLQKSGCIVHVIDLPGLPEKGDIMDWTGTAEELRALVDEALMGDRLPGLCGPETWDGVKAPDREWILRDWLVCKAAGLLSGQEGVGKSLLAQQMATCLAAGAPFLGLETQRARTLYLTCEDDMDELHRRQESINASLGLSMASLKGWLRTFSLKGEIGNELATFTPDGRMVATKRYDQVRHAVLSFGARLVFIDNAAHVFSGNENARHDVATFLGLLERLSIEINGAVVLMAHPNKQHAQGNRQGNEYAGSVGWSAHVRNRLFLDWDSPEDGMPSDPDARVLRRSKANYAARGEEVLFRWHKWAFVREDDLPANVGAEIAAVARANSENERFMECLAKLTEEHRNVSHSRSASNYAPKVMAAIPSAGGMRIKQLEAAMNRLLHLGTVLAAQPLWRGADRKPVLGLAINPDSNGVRDGAGRLDEKPQKTAREQFAESCGTARDGSIENGGKPRGEVRGRGCPNTTYIEGAASEAAAPSPEMADSDPASRTSFADDDGLDEKGDIIGWNE